MVKIKTILTILIYCICILGVTPVFLYLDVICRLIFVTSLIAGSIFDRKGRHYIHGLALTILSIVFFFYYALRISSDNLVSPAINILVILLSVRLLTEKTGRNCMQIAVLSLFTLAGSSLVNLGITFLLHLVLFLLCIAVFLVFQTFYATGINTAICVPDLKKIAATALSMPLISLPLMLVFFMIIPRTEYPLWNFLNSSGQKVTGFSEKVQPGSSTGVSESKNVVFRAQSRRLADKDLYWRGIVLDTMEGKTWVRSSVREHENTFVEKGSTVHQTIFPEPNTSPYLPALNLPVNISGVQAGRDPDYTFVRRQSRQKRVKYDSVSVLADFIGIHGRINKEHYLRTPAGTSRRIMSLAQKISLEGTTDEEKVMRLGQDFVTRKLSYTNNDLPRSEDPIDEFLFSKKAGNCEFFATSFAQLLRVMGIPSRLVGGYYGGTYNDMGGYYLVTEDMAHVWLEAYVDGKGWLMIDPSRFATNYAQRENRFGTGLFKDVRLMMDALGYYWNQTVISYDLEKQVQVLKKTNDAVRGLRFSFESRKLIYFVFPPFLCLLFIILRKKFRYTSLEEKILRTFIKKLRQKYPDARYGPDTGLHDMVKSIDDPAARQFVEYYAGVVYRDRKLKRNEYDRLRELADRI